MTDDQIRNTVDKIEKVGSQPIDHRSRHADRYGDVLSKAQAVLLDSIKGPLLAFERAICPYKGQLTITLECDQVERPDNKGKWTVNFH